MLADFAREAIRIFSGHIVFLAPEKRSSKYGKGPWDSVSDVDAGPAHSLTASQQQGERFSRVWLIFVGAHKSFWA